MKNKRVILRFAAVLMLAVMLAAALSACTDNGDDQMQKVPDITTAQEPSGTDAPDTEPLPAETTSGRDPSDLPDSYDLGGYEYRILNTDYTWDNFRCNLLHSEVQYGEVLNDAVYQRNLTMQEKYNFTIKEISNGTTDPTAAVSKAVLSGEDNYDVALCNLKSALKNVYNKTFLDVNEVPNINTSKNYWNQDMVKQLSLKGKVFFLSGDIILSDDDSLFFTMYNRVMAEDYGIENLYEVTRAGGWTYDKMIECIKQVVSDTNNDGKYDTNDTVGLLFYKGSGLGYYFASCDVTLSYTDANDNIKMIDDTARAVDAYDKLAELLTGVGNAIDWKIFGDSATQAVKIVTMIENKQTLFSNMIVSQVRRFYRDIKTDFGLLPLPKLSEQQSCYMTTMDGSQALFLPSSNKNPDKAGFITEALAAASYSLTDTYYHTALESKYTRDPESYEMIELGTEKILFDMANIYGWGSVYSSLNTGLHNGTAFSSVYESGKKVANRTIESFLASIEK